MTEVELRNQLDSMRPRDALTLDYFNIGQIFYPGRNQSAREHSFDQASQCFRFIRVA